MKIAIVFGTRPQFIKLAPLILENKKTPKSIDFTLINTGQHYDPGLSKLFMTQLGLPQFAYDFTSLAQGSRPSLGRMLGWIEEALQEIAPDLVIVFGDTDSTLAGALAANKYGAGLVHVEAGLRSWNRNMPEEINRILVDHMSDLLCAPNNSAVENLVAEGVDISRIENTGDIALASLSVFQTMIKKPTFPLNQSDFILITLHRKTLLDRLNFLEKVLTELEGIGSSRNIVWPMHPHVEAVLKKLGRRVENINTVEPQGYLEMLWLLKSCIGIITDSGGIQKEAHFFGKPCLIMREETEWRELLDGENVRLVDLSFSTTLEQQWTALMNSRSKNIQPRASVFEASDPAKLLTTIKNFFTLK